MDDPLPRGNVHSWTSVGRESVNHVNVNFAPDAESPLYLSPFTSCQLLLSTNDLPFTSYYLRLSFAMSQALSHLNDSPFAPAARGQHVRPTRRAPGGRRNVGLPPAPTVGVAQRPRRRP